MYEPLLLIHSWTRWAVFCAVIYFFGRSSLAWLKKWGWKGHDDEFIWAFNQVFAYQVAFGLTLWIGFSPLTKAAFKNSSLLAENGVISFWTLRHPLTMLLAFGAFHVGKARSRRVPAHRRFKVFAITFSLLLILILSAIPWPWLSHGRPFFRWIL